MSDRYLVATGNWNNTAVWSATNGGAGGASFPTSADNAFLTAASGAVTLTVNVSSACLGFNCTGFTGTLAGSAALGIYASALWSTGMTQGYTGILTMLATTLGHTLTFNGKKPTTQIIDFSGAGGRWTLQDALDVGIGTGGSYNTIMHQRGTLDTNGVAITCKHFESNGAAAATLLLRSSIISITNGGSYGLSLTGALTVDAGTSSIIITHTGAGTAPLTFYCPGVALYDVLMDSALWPLVSAQSLAASSFHSLRLTNGTGAPGHTTALTGDLDISTLTALGFAEDTRMAIVSSVPGTTRTITTESVYLAYADLSADIILVGQNGASIVPPAVLSYNSKHLFLTQKAYRFEQPDRVHLASRGKSASGIVETLNVRVDEIISLSFRNFRKRDAADATLKRNIQQWLQWAQNGNDWTFALYGAETFQTTLGAAAAVGSTTLTPVLLTGIQAGRTYILRSKTQLDVVKVLTVGASTVTLAEGLNFAFAIGDRFRSEHYWPGKLMEAIKPIVDRPPLFWDLDLDFSEDVNSL